jgi:hypothetical protein
MVAQSEGEMSRPGGGSSLSRTGEDLLVSLCGFATSLLTALILWSVEFRLGFAFYTWMFWFVVPVGALLAGLAAASGYYAGARIFNHRPTPVLLLNILAASVATFFAIHLLSYLTLQVEGRAVRDLVSFWRYLDISIRSTAMEFRVHAREVGTTGELGVLGYGVALLQILGFAAGGFAVYGYLVSVPYCERCARYFAAKGRQIRYTGDVQGLQASTAQVLGAFRDGAITAALAAHQAFGSPKLQKGNSLRSMIEVRHCRKCGQHWARFVVERRSGNNWKEIPNLKVAAFTNQAVEI